jgi:hypothetical protein
MDLTGSLLARAGPFAEVTAAGATVKEPAREVGGGRLVATVGERLHRRKR